MAPSPGGRGSFAATAVVAAKEGHRQNQPSSSETAKSSWILHHWKETASMSKLSNRTKNLLGKWKSHSQSVDGAGVVGAGVPGSSAHPQLAATPNSSCLEVEGGNAYGGLGSSDQGLFLHSYRSDRSSGPLGAASSGPASTNGHFASGFSQQQQQHLQQNCNNQAKAKWSEHVWSKSRHAFLIIFEIMRSNLVTFLPKGLWPLAH